MIYAKERELNGIRGEARKRYCVLLAFHKATIVPMAPCSFEQAGLLLDASHTRNPQIEPTGALARVLVPGFEPNDSQIYPDEMRKAVESEISIGN
jgi:hypothetical protein